MAILPKAKEEPFEEPLEEEVEETRYMDEGPAERKKGKTEESETAYMGEPEEHKEPKHEKEYRRGGPYRGRKATLQTRKRGKKK
ncbi:MAG: hypothetical protein IBX64_00890 [Actinobacteria bacterium]|nr:hypothetical protein [Actinomycetota bacterium]